MSARDDGIVNGKRATPQRSRERRAANVVLKNDPPRRLLRRWYAQKLTSKTSDGCNIDNSYFRRPWSMRCRSVSYNDISIRWRRMHLGERVIRGSRF